MDTPASSQALYHTKLLYRTCAVAAVRYVWIVRENQADAKYFIWRFVLSAFLSYVLC